MVILYSPDPITPETPISSLAKNTPMITVASSGADEPAAMNLFLHEINELDYFSLHKCYYLYSRSTGDIR